MKVLFDRTQIALQVARLGKELTRYYRGKDVTLVAIMNGAVFFAADLARAMEFEFHLDSIAVQSYLDCRSTGELIITAKPKLEIMGRHILLVDDVLDSGLTLWELQKYFEERGALSVKHCVAVQKDIARECGLQQADWCLFHAGNDYLVGYGMDANELYRNLPDIAAI